MSPVGHSIVGLTFATMAIPASRPRRWKLAAIVSFVALASLPDWPIPGWGHDRYDISHSMFVNAALIACVFATWRFSDGLRKRIPTKCLALGMGAWLSHLLLDSFYNHGRGVAIYWPLSNGRLNLAMPWFRTLDLSQSVLSQRNLSVFAIEFIAYLPLLVATVFLVRRNRTNMCTPNPTE